MDINSLYKFMKRSVASSSTSIGLQYYNKLDDDAYLDDGNFGTNYYYLDDNYVDDTNSGGGGNYYGYNYYGYNYNDNYYYYNYNNNYGSDDVQFSYSYSYSFSGNYYGSYSYYNNHHIKNREYPNSPSLPSKSIIHHSNIPSFTNSWCSKILPCPLSTIKIIVSLLFFLYCFTLVPASSFNFWRKKETRLVRKYRWILNACYAVVLTSTIVLSYYTFIVSYDKCMSNALDRILRYIWIAIISTDVILANDKTNLILLAFLGFKVVLDMISLMYTLQADEKSLSSHYYYHFSDDNYILAIDIVEFLSWSIIMSIFYFSSNMYVSDDTIKAMAEHLRPKKKITKNKLQYEQLNSIEEEDEETGIEMNGIKVDKDIEFSEADEKVELFADGDGDGDGDTEVEGVAKTFQRPKCKEYDASMCSRLYFIWVYPLLVKGFEKGQLTNDDLGALQGADIPKRNFLLLLDALQERDKSGRKDHLLTILFKLHGRDILACGFLLLFSIAGAIGSIFCLNLLLKELENRPYINWNTKYLYAFLLLIGKMIESSFEHSFWMEGIKISLRMQNSLISMCTYKSLRLSGSSKSDFDSGKVINLINVDSKKMTTLFIACLVHWGSWCAIATIIICIIGIKKMVGTSALLGLFIVLGMLPITFYISRSVKKYYRQLQEHRDKRAKVMGEAIKEIRYLKAFNCESFINSLLSAYRENELFSVLKYQVCLMLVVIITELTVVLVPVAVLGYFALVQNGELTSATVFTTIAWSSYLTRTVKAMPNLITSIYETTASLNRIDMLFTAAERTNEFDWLPYLKSQKELGEKVEFTKFGAGKEIHYGETASVIIRDANFSWTVINQQVDNEYILKNINISVGPGQLVFVIGQVGSGKSTLLMSILKETEASSNTIIDVKGSTAFVCDKPWLSANKSIKDNILMGRSYDEAWYEKCLNACCLIPDLKDLYAGDDSIVGDRGINLSGGQKQRINLCRAIYAKPDVILLDDVFSALDNVTGQHIFDACFTDTGILSKSIKIIATHQYNFLYSKHVDFIFVLKDGHITNQGDMDTLLQSKDEYVVDLIKSKVEKEESAVINTSLKPSKSIGEMQKLVDTQKNSQVSIEHKEYGAVKFRYMKNYLKGWGSYWLVLVVVLIAISEQILNVAITFRYSYITEQCDSDKGCSMPYKRSAMHLIFFMVGSLAVLKFVRAYSFVQGNFLASKKFEASMRKALFAAKISWFDRQLTGRIVNRLVSDISAIDQMMPHISLNLLQNVLSFLAVLVLVVIELPLALFSFIVAPLYYRIYQFYRWPSRDLKRLESIARSPVNSQLNEFISGLTTVRAFGLQLYMLKEHLKLLDDSVRCYYYQWAANQWVTTTIELLGCIFSSSITFSAVYYTLNKSVNPSTASMMISYANAIPMTLGLMLKFFCQAEIEAVSVERISEYIELPPEEKEGSRKPTDFANTSGHYGSGEIKLVNCSLRYGTDTTDSNNPLANTTSVAVLKNINLSITAGEKVAIVGRTGSGKSSLYAAIQRFYEYEGSIQIDGYELRDLTLSSVRSLLSLIPQDPLLLGLNLRSALTCGIPVPDEEIWSTLKTVHMDETIQKREGGLDMQLNFGENNFSAGEKQLLCAARALLKKAPILLCDEVASSLDQNSDEIINNIILNDDRTVISIMHRLQHCSRFDRIVVLSDGEIVEIGTHDQLLAMKGLFYEMINVQR